jgi:hypothetical protein
MPLPIPPRLSVPTQPADPDVFDDDEPVASAAGAPSSRAVVVKTYTDYSAVGRGSSRDNFAVLVHL